MTLVRWEPAVRNPWAGMFTLQRRMNRLFDEIFGTGEDADSGAMAWMPRVDVTEFDEQFELTAELPGLSREDVKVEVQDNVLTISGEKRSDHQAKNRNLFINERVFGTFRRSFQLPSNINQQSVSAEFKNGVLTIRIAKAEEAKPRQIAIKE